MKPLTRARLALVYVSGGSILLVLGLADLFAYFRSAVPLDSRLFIFFVTAGLVLLVVGDIEAHHALALMRKEAK